MPSHVPPPPHPHSESQPPSVINRGLDPSPVSSALPLLDCSAPDCLLRLSVVLWHGARGNSYPQQIMWPMCLSGRRGGIVTRLLEELEGVGYFTRALIPFVCRISAPTACMNLQQSIISDTASCPSVHSQTAIFNISLVRVAELLHISLGKCT